MANLQPPLFFITLKSKIVIFQIEQETNEGAQYYIGFVSLERKQRPSSLVPEIEGFMSGCEVRLNGELDLAFGKAIAFCKDSRKRVPNTTIYTAVSASQNSP